MKMTNSAKSVVEQVAAGMTETGNKARAKKSGVRKRDDEAFAPTYVLIDGNKVPPQMPESWMREAVVKGDAKVRTKGMDDGDEIVHTFRRQGNARERKERKRHIEKEQCMRKMDQCSWHIFLPTPNSRSSVLLRLR